MRREALGLALLAAGCITEAECDRRADAAHRDALRDAQVCLWNPEGLEQPACGGLDRRPLFTYYGVWCATAPLPCIREDDEVELACFGDPDDAPGEEPPFPE